MNIGNDLVIYQRDGIIRQRIRSFRTAMQLHFCLNFYLEQ